MNKKSIIRGSLAIVLAATLWSLDGTFLRPQLYNLPAELVVFLEHGLGALVFLFFVISGCKTIKSLQSIHRLSLIWVAVFGGILGTLFITKAFFLAIDGEVTFATVILLQKLQPVFALSMAAIILHERLPGRFYLRAGLAIASAYILAFGFALPVDSINWGHNGALFALIAAFAFGSSTVMSKDIVSYLPTTVSTGMRFLLVTILMGGYLFMNGEIDNIVLVSSPQWITLLVIVCSSGALAMFVYYRGLKRIKASQATVLELAWPLSALFLDWIINGNLLSPLQFFAAGVMIFAMTMVSRLQDHT